MTGFLSCHEREGRAATRSVFARSRHDQRRAPAGAVVPVLARRAIAVAH